MTQKNVEAVLKQWKQMREEIEQLSQFGQTSLKEIQTKIDQFVKSAEKDLKDIVEKDLSKLMKTFHKEKAGLEKLIEKKVNDEIKKATAFLKGHKKELNKIQKLVESYLPSLKKKATKKKATKKKVTKKKVAKKVAKKATKKKVAKKVTTSSVKKKTTKKKVAASPVKKKTTKKKATKKK